jgi:catechol-2,3-dioxygenase
MLGDHPIDVVLLATDLASSKQFYAGKLGLEILSESEEAITYKCGGDSQLAVTKSTTGTADEQTQAGWRVDDLAAELAELRSRGVEIQEYDMPGLKTVDGVADLGFALMAWIVDPHRNALAIMQLKYRRSRSARGYRSAAPRAVPSASRQSAAPS